MTNAERDYIIRYRQSGKSCAEIARILGLSANTVKSFCQRNSIVPIAPNTQASLPTLSETVCLCCGEKMELQPHRKPKRFCSDSCRLRCTPTGTGRKMPQTAAVSPAGVCFVLRGNKNIAATPAISKRDLEGTHMGAILTQEQFDREAGFRLSLSIMNRLMEENLLTQKEYGQIERILARKFSPVWAGLPDIIKDKSA